MKGKQWAYWLLAIIACGTIIGVLIYQSMTSYLSLKVVYVAVKEIPVNTQLTTSDFVTAQIPVKNMPSDAITGESISSIEGKYARSTILKDQTLVERAVSGAKTIREITQNISDKYVSMSIPLDQTDIPLSEIANGDVISLIGTTRKSGEKGEEIISEYIASNVYVVRTVDDSRSGNSKVIVLVPRGDAPGIRTALVAGKVGVAIDPLPFQNNGGATKK